ncbi:MAG: thioredoxin family protein [Ktedonobacterales bacterium]|nr:thioredoxin family protein [Ktedonobacterales bacterium]
MARKIEVLYFGDCPHYQRAIEVVRDLLRAEGITASLDVIAVETPEEAERQRFSGSPTIRVDGVDIAPMPEGTLPALACRVYQTAGGSLTPVPPVEMLLRALRTAPAG